MAPVHALPCQWWSWLAAAPPAAARRPVPSRRAPHGACASASRAADGGVCGIDLGTTNSAVAVVVDGAAVIVPDADGHRTTPSVVAYLPTGARARLAAAALPGGAKEQRALLHLAVFSLPCATLRCVRTRWHRRSTGRPRCAGARAAGAAKHVRVRQALHRAYPKQALTFARLSDVLVLAATQGRKHGDVIEDASRVLFKRACCLLRPWVVRSALAAAPADSPADLSSPWHSGLALALAQSPPRRTAPWGWRVRRLVGGRCGLKRCRRTWCARCFK